MQYYEPASKMSEDTMTNLMYLTLVGQYISHVKVGVHLLSPTL